jgi:hypothetical protein
LCRALSSATEDEDFEYFSNFSNYQLSLVVLYSDADALSPGFTVTDSTSIGRKRLYLLSSAGISDHELIQIDSHPPPPLILPAGKVTQGEIFLGSMQTSLRSRLSRMPHGLHIKDERKK